MSQNRRHRATSSTSTLLLQDIDDELMGWPDREDGAENDPVSSTAYEVLSTSSSEHSDLIGQQSEPEQVTSAFYPHVDRVEVADADAESDDDDAMLLMLAGDKDDEIGNVGQHQNLPSEWSWGEIDEFDSSDDADAEDDTSPGIADHSPERIALHDKAQRAAARILRDATWDPKEGLTVLTEILIQHHCHIKTIGALRELVIIVQVEPEMLGMLHDIRSAWRAHGYNRILSQSEANDGWLNLPWGMALHITESLGVQSANEVMEFIEVCFTDWCEVGFSTFPIFAYYLNFVLSTFDAPFADTVHTTPEIARAMLTDRGEQYDLPGNPVDQDLKYLGLT